MSSELWQERERQTLYKIASTLLSVRVCDSVSTGYVDDEDVPLCVHAYMMHVCMGVCMYEQICTVYACVCVLSRFHPCAALLILFGFV